MSAGLREQGISVIQLPQLVNPTDYQVIRDAADFLQEVSVCAIEVVAVFPEQRGEKRMLHSAYLRGAPTYLMIVLNLDPLAPHADGYEVSGWFGSNTIELYQRSQSERVRVGERERCSLS